MIWILFFVAGFLEDLISTVVLRLLLARRIYATTLGTFVMTLISLGVFYGIFVQIDRNPLRVVAIIIYAIGIAAGTFVGMKVKIKEGK